MIFIKSFRKIIIKMISKNIKYLLKIHLIILNN